MVAAGSLVFISGQVPATLDFTLAAVLTQNFVAGTLRNWLIDPGSIDLAGEAPRLADAMLEVVHGAAVLRDAK